jgi:hypothetical protein
MHSVLVASKSDILLNLNILQENIHNEPFKDGISSKILFPKDATLSPESLTGCVKIM